MKLNGELHRNKVSKLVLNYVLMYLKKSLYLCSLKPNYERLHRYNTTTCLICFDFLTFVMLAFVFSPKAQMCAHNIQEKFEMKTCMDMLCADTVFSCLLDIAINTNINSILQQKFWAIHQTFVVAAGCI